MNSHIHHFLYRHKIEVQFRILIELAHTSRMYYVCQTVPYVAFCLGCSSHDRFLICDVALNREQSIAFQVMKLWRYLPTVCHDDMTTFS